MREIIYKVEGMECTGCENRIQRAVINMNGVKEVKADYKEKTVKIIADNEADESKLREKIEDMGFTVCDN